MPTVMDIIMSIIYNIVIISMTFELSDNLEFSQEIKKIEIELKLLRTKKSELLQELLELQQL